MTIEQVFENYRSIAVYGMSTNPAKPSHYVPKFFIDNDYTVFPVNPMAEQIAGRKSYKNLNDIEEKIEVLNVFRPSEAALEVVQEAVERKKLKGDINLIWLQEGIINEEARKLAEANNIEFIQDKCMYREYLSRMNK